MNNAIKLNQLLPKFSSKLEQLLLEAKENEVASSLKRTSIYYRCSCEKENCCSFWTTGSCIDPRAQENHRSIWLKYLENDCIIDLVEEKIAFIEIIADDPNIYKTLKESPLKKKEYFIGKS